MLLSDRHIKHEIAVGNIRIEPYHPERVQPSSLDVSLGDTIRLYNWQTVDPYRVRDDLTYELPLPPEGFVLYPEAFLLATTAETLTLPTHLAARLEGRSTLGRLGLSIHSTAGFIDPGFSGQVTLEMSCDGKVPIMLYPGMPIGQLCFFQMTCEIETPYGDPKLGSKYQGQRGPTPPRSLKRF